MEDETKPKSSKVFVSMLLFLVLGMIISGFISFNQKNNILSTTEEGTNIGIELLEANKKQTEQIELLNAKITALEIKTENLEKICNSAN